MTNQTQTNGTGRKFSLLQAVRELRKPENRVSEEVFCRKHYQIVESLPKELDEKRAKSIDKQLLAEIAHYAIDSQANKQGYSEQERKYLHHVVMAIRGKRDIVGSNLFRISEEQQKKNKEFMYQMSKRFTLQNRDVAGRITGLAEVIAKDVFNDKDDRKRNCNEDNNVFKSNFPKIISGLQYVRFSDNAKQSFGSLPKLNLPSASGTSPLDCYLKLPEVKVSRIIGEKYNHWLKNNLLGYNSIHNGINDLPRFYREAITEIPGLKEKVRSIEAKHGVNFRLDEVKGAGE